MNDAGSPGATTVVVLLVDGAFDSGMTTVLDVFAAANMMRDQLDRPPPPWVTSVISDQESIRTAGGIDVATRPLATITHRASDVLVVPALGICTPDQVVAKVSGPETTSHRTAIRTAYESGVRLAAACSGTFFLAESGVLGDQQVTTSWWLGAHFRGRYPEVNVDTGERLIVGEGIATAGAAFAHIDLALSLVRQQSPAIADLVARYLLIGDQVSQACFAVPAVMAKHHPDVSRFERWIRANLDGAVRVGDAAACLGMSERSLQRATASVLGMTPIEFVNEVRVDEAIYLLRSTQLGVDVVARRVGFQNGSTLRDLVKRRRGATVRELRRHL